ncbi:hypothetical protein [Lysobacter panacisoli]
MLAPLSVERKRRKHDGMPFHSVPLVYWVTRRIESECDVASRFVDDVTLAAEVLRDRECAGKISITAVVARYLVEGEAPAGLYLDRATIAALAAIDADLDVDVVPEL